MTRRIIKINFSCLLLLLSFIPLKAQIIGTLNFSGNESFPESSYNNWAGTSPGSLYYTGLTDSISVRIAKGLSEEGYFNSHINRDTLLFSPDSQNVDLTFSIDEGAPTYIKNIFIDSDSVTASRMFNPIIGTIFSKNNIEVGISNLLNELETEGYPFASVKITSLYFYTDDAQVHQADINLSIEKNRLSKIDKIELTGNKKTKDYVILRNLGISAGDKFDQQIIDEIPQQLGKLRFFQPVAPPEFYFNADDEGILQITLKEKNTNNFDGIIGYVPGSENESGFFTGFINLGLGNIFGTGRNLGFKWQQEDRASQELNINYLEPWLFGYPFNVSFEFFQRKQDSTYVQRNIRADLEYLATQDISASFILSSESTIPTERLLPVFTVYNSTSITTGLNLKIDTRNDVYSPTEGIFFLNTYKYISKTIDGPGEYIADETETDIELQRFELDLNIFYQLFDRQVIALKAHARELRGSFFEISDLYLLGGTNTLRGYKEKQFAGNRMVWTNFEYRFLLSGQSFGFLFFDTGYYLRNEDKERSIPESSAFKIGYGAGINIETGLGILTVSYALAKGESFSDGKIHFGLLNEF